MNENNTNQSELPEITITAKRLSCALASDNFSEDKKDALLEILCVLESEAGVSSSHAELIKIAYPLMIKALNVQYGCGIHDAIRAIIESEERNNEAFENEVNQPQETDVIDVLDAEVIR